MLALRDTCTTECADVVGLKQLTSGREQQGYRGFLACKVSSPCHHALAMMLHHKSSLNATVQAQRRCSSRSLGVQHTAAITGRLSTASAVAAQALGTSSRHAGSVHGDGQQQQQQQHGQRQLVPIQCFHTHSSSSKASSRNVVTFAAAAAATASTELDELIGPSSLEPAVFEIITYALKLAWTSETYYVHSWMVLLGLLKKEDSIACEVSFILSKNCLRVTQAFTSVKQPPQLTVKPLSGAA